MFSVRLSGEVSFAHDEKVTFDNIITNIGNAYDSATGNFTVPYNESYELTLMTMGKATGAPTNIMRADVGLCQAFSKEGGIMGKKYTVNGLLTAFGEIRRNVR